MTTGIDYFRKFMEEHRNLPDAFICANDNIAAGLIYEAQKRGFNIPGDFAVVGFDNLDKAVCFNPQITTVSHKRELMGEMCMNIFERLWKKEQVGLCHYLEPEISYTESCGCAFSTPIDFRDYARKNIVENERRRQFEEKRIGLEAKLSGLTEFKEIFCEAGEYFKQLDCDGITLVIDERIIELEDERKFPVMGYDRSKLKVVYSDDADLSCGYEDFDTFWSRTENMREGNVFMFSPFHYRDRTIGFSILKNGKFLYDNPFFYDIQSLINRVVWDTYQRKCYIEANRKLDNLYKRDALTGIYNRLAYYQMAETMVNECRIENRECMLAFFDCDNFKKINDEQGHDAGDEILKKIGAILLETCNGKGGAFRFGGDEFVIVYPMEYGECCDDIIERLRMRFMSEGICVSVGCALIKGDGNKSIQEYLNMADQLMYENKREKKYR